MSTYQLKTVPLGPLSLSKTTTSRLHSSSTTNQSSPIPSPNQASDQHQPADHLHLIQLNHPLAHLSRTPAQHLVKLYTLLGHSDPTLSRHVELDHQA
ncbi:hypothetical protein PGT21_008175 [Puccinia graminis f. sp. tritici]|uniref:Uncharacterized protein n=1 Tax=Puccinia graminis f. sp. tritici TaxID=56615 RepID=A0A5B0LIA1_PUCGR|nr:hypothetical protein PGT21_008175 [Puccinia graminis f. sp. tritici]